ncbi:MAG: type II secretion system protein M [Deltaproteobacteria bacterium]|nr:type II secretion system protein M [Deltaproteobacteria bacterium]
MTERSKYSLLGRINFEDLYNAFLGLEQRQQTFIVIGGVVLAILLIILPISCATSRLGKLGEDYEKSREGMSSFMSKIHDYQASKKQLAEVQKQLSAGGGQSLTTVLEALANEEGIGGNIEKLKPVNMGTSDYFDETGVDATISKVTLDQIVGYLSRIETHPDIPMKVKKMQIKPRYGGRSQLTLTFQVSTMQIKKEAETSE